MTTEELLEFLWQQAVSVGYDKGREAFDSMESESFEELKAKLRAAEEEMHALKRRVEQEATEREESKKRMQLIANDRRLLGEQKESLLAALASMTAERDDFRKRIAEMRAGVARLDQQTNDLLAERTNLRHDLEDARDALKKCATGPWIEGKPEVMDGRKVLVMDGGDPLAFSANDIGFSLVTHHAEINRPEGGTE